MKSYLELYKALPIEAGKTYRTKLQTGESFTVTRDQYRRHADGLIIGDTGTVHGIWEKAPHLGECPLYS